METTLASLPNRKSTLLAERTDFPVEKGTALAVAVDLTPLLPGESNGSIKTAIFRLLSAAMQQTAPPVVFLFLTNSATQDEVRHLARPQDLLICVSDGPHCPLCLSEPEMPLEFLLSNPPAGFLGWTGVDLLYAPFGNCTFHSKRIPTVALIADVPDDPLGLNQEQIERREASLARTIQCASMIQCVSRSGVERLMAHYHVPEEKLFYTYPPVPVGRDAAPDAPDFVRQQGLEAPFFFAPANLWKYKSYESLLQSYRLYREQAGDAAWDIVLTFQDAPPAAEIHALARELGIESHLRYPGSVSDAQLQELWRHAGALVFPSLYGGLGTPLLEAMHYGVPIVTGDDLALREIVGDAACFIHPREPQSIASALRQVSGEPELRASLRRRGNQRLGFFDLGVETCKLLGVWSALPGCKEGFPRKARIFEKEAVLALPTPASDALWKLEIRVNPRFPQNRYSFYLDDAAQGSFSIVQNGQPAFQFDCRPLSRTLRVLISRDRTVAGGTPHMCADAIEAITASNRAGQRFPLFQKTEREEL